MDKVLLTEHCDDQINKLMGGACSKHYIYIYIYIYIRNSYNIWLEISEAKWLLKDQDLNERIILTLKSNGGYQYRIA
jgi:hypothetical protein